MNNRIDELAEQCTYTTTDYSMGIDSSMEGFDKQKFAELIVKECVDQCADNGSSDEWDRGVRWAADQIKQHFGVE